ncbi:MAG: hypothetical protein ACRD8W_01975 [Nitrososphaeraceae archaeon]
MTKERIDWLRARNLTKDKTEKSLLSLKLAKYDYRVARMYGNREGAKKARKRMKDIKRRLNDRKLKAELKAIDTVHKNLKKQIEYEKKLGMTFSFEKRNGQKYLYRQKRGQRHEYVAKDWEDLDNKQHLIATTQVWEQSVLKHLSLSEIDTLHIIEKEIYRHSRAKNRDPLIEKYRKQLGLSIRCIALHGSNKITRVNSSHKIIYINKVSVEEVKNTLRAARKALIRRGNVDKKLEAIAICMGEGEDTPQNIENFIVFLMKEIGFKQETVNHAVRALENYINRDILRRPETSMYKVLEPIEVRIFSEVAVKRFVDMGGHFTNGSY